MRNLVISNVEAIDAGPIGCAVCGLPEHPIENLTLENIRLWFEGGRAAQPGLHIPEKPSAYPEYQMFGRLPAYGIYLRHVRNVRLRGLQTGFRRSDERPALVGDDLEGLDLSAANLATVPGGGPAVWLNDVRAALITACRLPNVMRCFLRVSGPSAARITAAANDFSGTAQAIETDPGVPTSTVFASANRN
jgi:hypothetical protein